MSLRLATDQAEALEKVAEVDGVSISEAIRDAIQQHIESRVIDEEFRSRLKESIQRNQRILDRLAQA
jgi:hypothetical protein